MSSSEKLSASSLMSEWDSEQNDKLGVDPEKLGIHSNKKVWWVCKKGHHYESSPEHRFRGENCPYCSNRRILVGENDLQTTNPELVGEWDYEANFPLLPTMVVPGSSKKVHWVCKKCGNKWVVSVLSRAKRRHTGCPVCGRLKRAENRHFTELAKRGGITDPVLLQDFDYEKNAPLTPSDFTPSTDSYVFWKCHVCGYEWKAKVNNRDNGRGCPLCSNKVVVEGKNDLATTDPEIAKEWHPFKNGSLKPTDVTRGTGKKVWWLCPRGHEYQATVLHRASGGTGCPVCISAMQTSFAEQAVFYYVHKVFPDAINRYKAPFLGRMELDIFIPSIRTAIEYDGMAWHKSHKRELELEKRNRCNRNGIKLWRLREAPLEKDDYWLADHCMHVENMYDHFQLNQVIWYLIADIDKATIGCPISIDVDRDRNEILSYKKELDSKSIKVEFPELSDEWDTEKNGILKPSMFTKGSDHKVWWICPICNNEYEATISHRVRGTGCPKCARKKINLSRARAVQMIDPESGNVLREFESISTAARELKLNGANIGTVCRGGRPLAGGYSWKYKDL